VEEIDVLWITAGLSCDGDSVSVTAATLPSIEDVVTVMNPGGAGPRRFKLPPSVGILELEPGIPPRGRLVPLAPFDDE
jgi:hypothetical protein